MASSISAGTTSGTALVHTADTTGALELKTNNGTTALTLSTAQNATFAGTLTTAAQGIAKASLPAGTVLQVVNVQTGALATTTTVIPFDDTIPQNTEGTELFTLAITPTSATSKLYISATLQVTHSPSNWTTFAVFQDTTANAIAVTSGYISPNTGGVPLKLAYYMTSGTTSSTTFKLRYGSASGTVSVNGAGGARFFGGVWISSMTIMEIAV